MSDADIAAGDRSVRYEGGGRLAQKDDRYDYDINDTKLFTASLRQWC